MDSGALSGDRDADLSLPDEEGERTGASLDFALSFVSFLLGDNDSDLVGLGEGERVSLFFGLVLETSAGQGDDEDTLLSCCGKNALSGEWPNNKTVLVFLEPDTDGNTV